MNYFQFAVVMWFTACSVVLIIGILLWVIVKLTHR